METKSPIKYLNSEIKGTNYVFFSLLKEDGNIISDWQNQGCFAAISTGTIPKGTTAIIIYQPKESVGYSVESIERWINDISELGFQCSYVGYNIYNHNFQVNIIDYKYKCHLLTTLMLIRALWEPGLNRVPEIYFQMMDKSPNDDKFDYLQTAHKALPAGWNSYTKQYNNTPTGHMATYNGNGKNVSRETLFTRYRESETEIFCIHLPFDYKNPKSYTRITQNDKWNGG